MTSHVPTHELVAACVPTRADKQLVARRLGKSESLVYKWCEDPIGGGRQNPLDVVEVILDHARLHHPHGAFAIEHRMAAGNARAVSGGARGLLPVPLLTSVQPGVEKETNEALASFTAAMRKVLLGGTADLRSVYEEVHQAEMEMKRARLMLAAALELEQAKAGTPE